jgi:hypothetical protein
MSSPTTFSPVPVIGTGSGDSSPFHYPITSTPTFSAITQTQNTPSHLTAATTQTPTYYVQTSNPQLVAPPMQVIYPPGVQSGAPTGSGYVSYKQIYKAQKKVAKENKKAQILKVKEQYKELKKEVKGQKDACKGYVKEAVRTAKLQVASQQRSTVACETCNKEHVPVFQIQSGPSTTSFCSMPW